MQEKKVYIYQVLFFSICFTSNQIFIDTMYKWMFFQVLSLVWFSIWSGKDWIWVKYKSPIDGGFNPKNNSVCLLRQHQ